MNLKIDLGFEGSVEQAEEVLKNTKAPINGVSIEVLDGKVELIISILGAKTTISFDLFTYNGGVRLLERESKVAFIHKSFESTARNTFLSLLTRSGFRRL